MIFNKIVGHQKLAETLKKSQLGQAYLFSGPSGIGKKLMAQAVAQKILCNEHPAPCGKCPACLQVEKLTHPDLLLYSTDDTFIKVENIREILSFVNLRSFLNGPKVVIIDEAQKMNPQAANALLKTLEEPPENTYIILVTSNKGSMLTTILSRCQKFQFGSLSVAELQKIAPDTPPWAFDLSQGRLDILQKWLDPNKKELKDVSLKAFQSLADLRSQNPRTYDAFANLEALTEDKESAFFAITLWQHWIKQIFVNPENPMLQQVSKKMNPHSLLKISETLVQLERDVTANVNRKLAFENFFIGVKNQV